MPKFYVYTLSYPPEMGGHVFYVGKARASEWMNMKQRRPVSKQADARLTLSE